MNSELEKYREAVIEYEASRMQIIEMTAKMLQERNRCTQFHNKHGYARCTSHAWEAYSPSSYEEEISKNDFIAFMRQRDDVCDHCINAYLLKNTKLRAAKKRHGEAKRNLSRLGKRYATMPTILLKGVKVLVNHYMKHKLWHNEVLRQYVDPPNQSDDINDFYDEDVPF